MQAVKNPIALDLADGVRKTVAQNDVVNDTLDRYGELLQLQNYFKRQAQKEAEKVAISAEATGMEKMIIVALQGNTPSEVIESMRKNAGITETRLSELKKSIVPT